MRNHDGVTPIGRCGIQQLPNQLSSRLFFRAGKFIEDREILRCRPLAEGQFSCFDASTIRAGQHRAYRNPQGLERRTDISGFLPSRFVEISLTRAIPIVVGALSRNKAVCRHVTHQDDEPPLLERPDELLPLQLRL